MLFQSKQKRTSGDLSWNRELWKVVIGKKINKNLILHSGNSEQMLPFAFELQMQKQSLREYLPLEGGASQRN